jgi:hypothetical protein
MPLTPGKSKATISQNIREMENSGHPHNVSVAAAMREAYDRAGGGAIAHALRIAMGHR